MGIRRSGNLFLLSILWLVFLVDLSFGGIKGQEKGIGREQSLLATFLEGKRKIEDKFNQEKQRLMQEMADISSKIKVEEERKALLQTRSMAMRAAIFAIKRLQDIFTYLLFPFGGLFSQLLFGEYLLNIIFPITLINIIIFLIFWEKELLKKRKWLIIGSLVAIFILFSLPVLAQDTSQVKEIMEEPISIENKLDLVNRLMEMNDVERAIFKLEEGKRKGKGKIHIKKLGLSNPNLHPWEEVDTNRPEYAYTLGCLYIEKGEFTKAILRFGEVLDYDFSRYSPAYLDLLVSLVKFFVDQGEVHRTKQALEKALPLMQNSESFIQMAEFLYKKQWTDQAVKVLQAARNQAKDPQELLQIAAFALANNLEELASDTIQGAIGLAYKHTQLLQIAKFSLDKGRRGDAIAAIEKATSSEDASALLDIAQFAAQNKLYNKAYPPLERIVEKFGLGFASEIKVLPPMELTVTNDLPTPDGVSLPVYLGILYQKLKRFKDAETAYERAALNELDNIILAGGDKEEINANLNTFFYLWQLWTYQGEKDKGSKLAPLYGLLELKYLDKLKKEYEESLSKLEEENQKLSMSYQKKSADTNELQKEVRRVQLEIGLYSLRLLAIFSLIVILAIWAITRSWKEAKGTEQFKTFVFFAKLTEIYGWISCFTVVGILTGLIFVLFGQLMKIIHSQIPGERTLLDTIRTEG